MKRPLTPPQVLQTVEVRLEEELLQASSVRAVATTGIQVMDVDRYEDTDWVDNSDPNIVWD